MNIEVNFCEVCDEPLMQSNIIGWTCTNEKCEINKLYKD
jgi:hypothetical protein